MKCSQYSMSHFSNLPPLIPLPDKSNMPHLLSLLMTILNSRLEKFWTPNLFAKPWNILFAGLVMTNWPGSLWDWWKTRLSWFIISTGNIQRNHDRITCHYRELCLVHGKFVPFSRLDFLVFERSLGDSLLLFQMIPLFLQMWRKMGESLFLFPMVLFLRM